MEGFLLKFHISVFLRPSVPQIQDVLESDKNNKNFTEHVHTFMITSR